MALEVKNPPANSGLSFDPRTRKVPWKRAWQTTPVFLENCMHSGAWQATVHGVAKSQT